MNLPWPYIRNLPLYFYRIYLPSINDMSSILNSNYDSLSFSPIKSSTINSTNRYENDLFSDNLNSNSFNNETNIWSNSMIGSYPQVRFLDKDIIRNILFFLLFLDIVVCF
jgi:hypothetical protein